MTLAESHRLNCSWKTRYADEFTAMKAYVETYPRTLKTAGRRHVAKTLTLYVCSHCGYIHLSQHGTKRK